MAGGGDDLRRAFEEASRTERDQADSTVEETVQVLTFSLADEWYGFRLRDLVEIIGGAEPTPIPFTPPYVPGVINHRGSIVSVVDLKHVFGLPGRYRQDTARTVLVQSDGMVVGFQADDISDVVEVPARAIEAPLSTMERVKAAFIEGCIRLDRGLLVLLDSASLVGELRPSREPGA